MIKFYIKSTYLLSFSVLISIIISCAKTTQQTKTEVVKETIHITPKKIKTGADRLTLYLPQLQDKNIALVANQTSIVEVLQRAEVSQNTMGSKSVSHHLVDYLHSNKRITIKKVFAPEHGFRGKADAGEKVVDGIDQKTGISIVSLYGKNKKPTQSQLEGIDIVVFDIQDVGARFYTYISTLHYVMEACAEANIPVIVLDRPNPNGHYIDGPILEKEHKSFVGMHPVPIVYGMTIGEYGQMINGELWLKNGIQCNLTVVPLENYTHQSKYKLPIKPSPNLPNEIAINLYPSLCFFEGTNVSAGRGTAQQFQIYGAPNLNIKEFSFTPKPNEGAKYPKHENKVCYGENLTETDYLNSINLEWLMKAYQNTEDKNVFFTSFFTTLAGTTKLKEQIVAQKSIEEIKASWQNDIEKFKETRAKYLIYE